MSTVQTKYRFLFAGGGTGGHLFPAVAVAEQIRELKPEADILFIGTKDKIEGRVVPKLGFKFNSIWIKGFSRKLTLENLLFPLKLFVASVQSLIINMSFKPKVLVDMLLVLLSGQHQLWVQRLFCLNKIVILE
jgi:UDP-N-acetylglucosamine--N-acetylmuramyl-(pentapeptide) pyrophosphoryl-undecaprenol N-acetylglucosamine transferase